VNFSSGQLIIKNNTFHSIVIAYTHEAMLFKNAFYWIHLLSRLVYY